MNLERARKIHNSGAQKRSELIPALMLLLAACIWGFAFVAQSVGAQYVGPFTFLTIRCWIAVAFLTPVVAVNDSIRERKGLPKGKAVTRTRKKVHLIAGLACGSALFSAAAAQQIGIGGTTTAKASFITALYVIMVPLISIILGHMPGKKLWICVAVSLAGLYLLCFTDGIGGINRYDGLLLLCALLFAVQILAVNHFLPVMEGVRLSRLQLIFEAIFSTIGMLLLEHPDPAGIRGAMPAILYAGILSSGVAFTLQIIGQEGLNPTVASLLMCMESVFGALGGWFVQGQALSGRELAGCALMFAAIVFSQLPSPRRRI